MTDFEKIVEKYMQCDKRTLAELLALKEIGEPQIVNPIDIEEPKTPKKDVVFPPYPYMPMPNIQPNVPDSGHPPMTGPWGPIVWCTTNTQYIN